MKDDYEKLLTPSETAAFFRVDPKTLVRWVNAGKLTAIRTPGGTRRFREKEVLALIDASREGSDRTGGMRMTQIHLTAAHFVAASKNDPCRTAVALAVGEAVPGVLVTDHGDALSYRLTEAESGGDGAAAQECAGTAGHVPGRPGNRRPGHVRAARPRRHGSAGDGMRRRYGRHGAHRVPAPGSLHALADEAKTRAQQPTTLIKVVPPGDTVTFDVPGSWAGPLPQRQPGARRPPARGAGPDLEDLRRVRDSLAAMGQTQASLPENMLPVPSFIYPPTGRDPGPREYARLMRRVSALTGTTSSYRRPGRLAGAAITATPNGGNQS